MILLVVALKAEATPLIEEFGLKKCNDEIFDIYENRDIKLIISGINEINCAIATTYIALKSINQFSKFINIGICGSKKEDDIGKLYKIDKIIDNTTHKVYHLKRDSHSTSITSSKTAIDHKNSIKSNLVDMESLGFYQASCKFTKKDNIIIIKIVSDNLDTKIKNREYIYQLFKNNMNKIKELIC